MSSLERAATPKATLMMGYIMGCACFKGKFHLQCESPVATSERAASLARFAVCVSLFRLFLFLFHLPACVCVTASCFLPLIRHISSWQKATLQPASPLSLLLVFLLRFPFARTFAFFSTAKTSLNDVTKQEPAHVRGTESKLTLSLSRAVC